MDISKEEELFRLINTNGTTYGQYLQGVEQISDINYTERLFHRSFLHVAVSGRLDQISEDLLRRGIDVNIKDKKGNTAAIYAASGQKWDLLTKILDYSPDVNIQNNQGETILMLVIHYAGARKNDAIRYALVRKIVELGGDPLMENICKITAMQMAVQRNDMEVVKFFQEVTGMQD